MNYKEKFMKNVKELDKFSVYVIDFGLRLSFGLILLSAFLYSIMGKFGDYLSAMLCAQGALDAAPAVLVSAIAAALISDIVIKDRAARN